MGRPGRIVFVTTPHLEPWSGAEELWSRSALALVGEGIPVSASVWEGSLRHPRMLELQARGVELWPRPQWYSLRTQPWQWLRSRRDGATALAVERLLQACSPALAVLSDGISLPPIQLLDLCVGNRIPFATLAHSSSDSIWYPDILAARYRAALAVALRCYFVSQANRRLTEKHIGGELAHAEPVWNPFNVSFEAQPPWPDLDADGALRFACVGRLHPPSKAQDLLIEALARPEWSERSWRLYLYGEGGTKEGLERLARTCGISQRVVFAGHVAPERIWAANHVLVVPSRLEGLPMVTVEAMLCARPVIVTEVGRHTELVEDGVTGFLAEAATPRAMAAAMERFWARRGEAEEMGKAGRRRIEQLLPRDPVQIFVEKLKDLAAAGTAR